MSSCLGIYVDKNLIKYAKIKKINDSFEIESYNVEVFENLKTALEKVISETNSYKIPISINISNELYNYFDVFSVLEKKDIKKSLDIEFEIICSKKGYDKKVLDSKYILMENKDDYEKYKALYISANKKELEEKKKILAGYKLFSMTPVSTSITNLIEANENVAIVNIENETTITTVLDGQISRVDVLNSGMEEVIEKVNKLEMSWKKAYEVCKNITLYNHEVQSLDKHENEYIDIVMPVLNKITKEATKVLNCYKEKISKIYITGMGATINNIDLYFQEYLKNTNCEILKPFFIESNSLRIPIKEYIEVNSAIALALDGLGCLNKDLNFVSLSSVDNIRLKNVLNSKGSFNVKKILTEPFSIKEKLITRGIFSCIIAIIAFIIFGNLSYNNNVKQMEIANEKILQTNAEFAQIESELFEIENYTNAYISFTNSTGALKESTNNIPKKRVIAQNSIPNMLNKIMFIIPQKVQIISIENTNSNHIVIEAVSEKYEQLGYFIAAIKANEMLENIQSTAGDKSDSLVKVIIEGDLK